MFFGCASARNLWRKSLTRIRVLRVFRGFFGGCLRQEIFGGNLVKEVAYARNNLKFREAANKIFKKISTENALEYLASGKGFVLDRLTARNLN